MNRTRIILLRDRAGASRKFLRGGQQPPQHKPTPTSRVWATARVAHIYIGLLLLMTACGPLANTNPVQLQATVTINPSFQQQISPIPTPSEYRCGAWSSNNAPKPGSTITIYARLTKNIMGVSGATASAVVHFKDGDQPLDQQATSDSGGYVSFSLPLQDRQPVKVPATVDVTFSNFAGGPVTCTAFFAPR